MVLRLRTDRRSQLAEDGELVAVRPGRLRHKDKRHFHYVLGILVAALLFEMWLRPFVADTREPGRVPIRTIRNYVEGVSVAGFESDGIGPLGSRLTGDSRLAGAPEGVIVGDSHVAAYAVRDEDTMGALVEHLSRSSGQPLNVRQYGWPGANAGTFIALTKSILAKRKPVWIAVLLNSYNVGVNALAASDGWRMEVQSDYSIRLIHASETPRTPMREILVQSARHSALALAIWRRIGLLWTKHTLGGAAIEAGWEQGDPGLSEEAARVVRATVLALKEVAGARLIIVYTPPIGVEALEPIETELRMLCAEQGLGFLSVREALLDDRVKFQRLSRGFHNTAPGVGHFNAVGHKIIGQQIWRYLCARPLSASRSR